MTGRFHKGLVKKKKEPIIDCEQGGAKKNKTMYVEESENW